MSRRRREAICAVLLVLGSLCLVLFAGEVALRVLYARDQARGGTLQESLERSERTSLEENTGEHSLGGLVKASRYPDIVYELKPNLRVTCRSKTLRVSSAGLRDREYPVEKEPGTCRIVGLGDSIMFGWGVLEEETYLNLIEEWLNGLPQPHPRNEVLNFAVLGHNTVIEVVAFRDKALPYDRDLAIIHFVNNDTGASKFMLRQPCPLSLRRSCLLDLVLSRLGVLRLERKQRLVGYRMEEVETLEERQEIVSRYDYMVGGEGYLRAMNLLGDLARENGIRVIVLVGSTREGQKEVIEKAVEDNGFDIIYIGPVTDRMLDAHDVPDEENAFRRAVWVGKKDSHPNAFGHYSYATGLWEELQETGVIPPSPTLAFTQPIRR